MQRNDKTCIISGDLIIENEYKDALHLEMNIKNATKGTELELPYLFYPGYVVKLQTDSEEYELEYEESQYGFIQVVIPEEINEGKIIVDYTATVLDKASYILSGISFVLFIGYVIYFRRKTKKEEINEE